jgi:hypothetical protein
VQPGAEKRQGFQPGKTLNGPEEELANTLKQIKNYVIVHGLKGDFRIQKNRDRGDFSVDEKEFSKMVPPRRMSPEDAAEKVSQLNNRDFGIVAKENKNMNSSNIVKKDLLRRKVAEHFAKHPNAKSIIVSINIDENRTVWKVDKTKTGYTVVEVNTQKEQFMLEATLGQQPIGAQQGTAEFKQIMSIMTPIMGNLGTSQAQAATARNQINTLIGKVVSPKEKAQAAGFLNYLGALTGGQMAQMSPQTPIAQAPGAVPQPAAATGLMAGKINKGRKLHEEEDKKDKKKPEKKDDKKGKKKPAPKVTPGAVQDPGLETPPQGTEPEMAPQPDGTVGGGDAAGAGLEANPTPETPTPDSPAEPEVPAAAPKTGEELSLQQLTQTKPIKDLQVFGDEQGGHVTLSLGGLKNPVQINFAHDGKITYKFGELSRVLKVGK